MIVRIGQSVFIALPLPLMEVFMHLPHIIKQVTKANTIRLITELVFIRFQGISGIRCLSPFQWEADTLSSDNAETVCQPDTLIIPQFQGICQVFLKHKPYARLHPQPKGWGFDGKIDKTIQEKRHPHLKTTTNFRYAVRCEPTLARITRM